VINAQAIASLGPDGIRQAVARLSMEEVNSLLKSWRFWARPEQVEPPENWVWWLFLAGRSAGKTRSGAEWVKEQALQYPGIRIALVGPTAADVRDTMLHGHSGLMSLDWDDSNRPKNVARKIMWPNGSKALTYSAEKPVRLRGPNFHLVWMDELAAWRYMQETFDMVTFAMRLEYPGGNFPRAFISTTPRPLALIKDLVSRPSTAISTGTTYDNRSNLSPIYFSEVIKKYEGTSLGRQELLGQILDTVDGALWQREWFDKFRVSKSPPLARCIVAVDPSASDKEGANETGIIGCGLGDDDRGYVLLDRSTHGKSPGAWAKVVVDTFYELKADTVVVEGNLGGEMVKTVLRQIDPGVPITLVQATRDKYTRAQPVALLYETGRVSHVGSFPKLEDQCAVYTPEFKKENPGLSPDRMDALVWGLTNLMLKGRVAI
jgi:phage terminase large subunit-like protein